MKVCPFLAICYNLPYEAAWTLNSAKTFGRWRTSDLLGISGLHHPRDPTNLRRRPLVLGIPTDKINGNRRFGQFGRGSKSQNHSTCGSHCSLPDVCHRRYVIPRPAEILSSSSWQDALLLHVHLSPQNHPRESPPTLYSRQEKG